MVALLVAGAAEAPARGLPRRAVRGGGVGRRRGWLPAGRFREVPGRRSVAAVGSVGSVLGAPALRLSCPYRTPRVSVVCPWPVLIRAVAAGRCGRAVGDPGRQGQRDTAGGALRRAGPLWALWRAGGRARACARGAVGPPGNDQEHERDRGRVAWLLVGCRRWSGRWRTRAQTGENASQSPTPTAPNMGAELDQQCWRPSGS